MNNKLVDILSFESKQIAISFDKASIEGAGTPQEVSDRREGIVKCFLEKFFPFPYKVVKGNIVDSYGESSNSIDCIVINPCHPYTIDKTNEKASLILADGVDFAFEIKPKLTSTTEIERALAQVQSVKRLKRVKDGLFLRKRFNNDQKECAKTIPCIIFANETYKDIKKLIATIYEYYSRNHVPALEQFDLIIINNQYLIYNFRDNSYFSNSMMECIAYWEGGENCLVAMLYEVNSLPRCEPLMGENIMEIYLKDVKPKNVHHFKDLDDKYHCNKLNS